MVFSSYPLSNSTLNMFFGPDGDHCTHLFRSQDAGRVRDEGEQALELAERVRVNAEAQRAEAEGMFLVAQEKERQLAQVFYLDSINRKVD